MAVHYQAVLWNKQKKTYDLTMIGLMLLYLVSFIGFNVALQPEVVPPTLIARSTGSLALIMLHVVLVIGPLSRLDRRFLPLLYNRRHLGVAMFVMGSCAWGVQYFYNFTVLETSIP